MSIPAKCAPMTKGSRTPAHTSFQFFVFPLPLVLCFFPSSAGMMADCASVNIPTATDVRARTTHLIATPNEVAANTSKVQKALKKQIPIVSEASNPRPPARPHARTCARRRCTPIPHSIRLRFDCGRCLSLARSSPPRVQAFLRDSLAAGAVVQDISTYLLVQGGAGAATANTKQVAAAKAALPAPTAASRLGAAEAANVMLAQKYEEGKIDPTGWFISEKLDGVRAYWSGEGFYSRNGNQFHAPAWYTKDLPKEPLDGELWAGR